mmetsp:Transcript_35543/g.58238  ORF Transcript_35543/g.58238 Transcript_35543/m.58238 type:complete len:214 (+) Transcript_35543:354-995(+)
MRIIFKMTLYKLIRVVSDILNTLLIDTNGTITASAPKQALFGVACHHRRVIPAIRIVDVRVERGVRHVIIDTNHKTIHSLALVLVQVVENRTDHGRCKLLGRQSILSASDHIKLIHNTALRQCHHHVHVQWLGVCAILACSIQHGNLFHVWQSCLDQLEQMFRGPRTIQSNLDDSDLLVAVGVHLVNHLFRSTAARTHHHDASFSVHIAIVIK